MQTKIPLRNYIKKEQKSQPQKVHGNGHISHMIQFLDKKYQPQNFATHQLEGWSVALLAPVKAPCWKRWRGQDQHSRGTALVEEVGWLLDFYAPGIERFSTSQLLHVIIKVYCLIYHAVIHFQSNFVSWPKNCLSECKFCGASNSFSSHALIGKIDKYLPFLGHKRVMFHSKARKVLGFPGCISSAICLLGGRSMAYVAQRPWSPWCKPEKKPAFWFVMPESFLRLFVRLVFFS